MIRVLIVEDDPMVADLAAVYLEGIEGFCLEGRASSGEAALELLRAGEIDLVLLDMFMPGMTGMELLRIIKTSFFNTDVIMITAAQNSDDILNALRMGVADYIVKPFTVERFRTALEQLREKRQLLTSPEVPITQEILDKRYMRMALIMTLLGLAPTGPLADKPLAFLQGAEKYPDDPCQFRNCITRTEEGLIPLYVRSESGELRCAYCEHSKK